MDSTKSGDPSKIERDGVISAVLDLDNPDADVDVDLYDLDEPDEWRRDVEIVINTIYKLFPERGLADLLFCGFHSSEEARTSGTTFAGDSGDISTNYTEDTDSPLHHAFMHRDENPRLAIYDRKRLESFLGIDRYKIIDPSALLAVIKFEWK